MTWTKRKRAKLYLYFCFVGDGFYRAGGPWLVADMQRQLSLFELQPSFRREVEHGKVVPLTCAKPFESYL